MSNERKRMFELAYKLAENLELAHGMTLDKREVAAGFTPIITEFLAADLWHDSQPVAAPLFDAAKEASERVESWPDWKKGSPENKRDEPVAAPKVNNVEQTDVIDNSAKITEIRARLETCHWVDNSDEGVGKLWKWLFEGGLHNEQASFLAQAQRDVALLLCEIDNRTSRPVADPVAPLVEAVKEAKLLLFYITNLATNAWRDPRNLEAICTRIVNYGKDGQQKMESALAAYEGRRR